MKERKKAGHLLGARIVEAMDCVVVVGRLLKDQRGTHHHGGSRDFSGQDIHTSWLERVEYVETADTTVIYTRNSIYFAQGNIVEVAFGEGKFSAEGKAEMKELFVKHLSTQKPEVDGNSNVVYELTQAGADVSGKELGAYIVVAPTFADHNLCAPNEVPFSLLENKGTSELHDVVFLNRDHIKRASLPLKESK